MESAWKVVLAASLLVLALLNVRYYLRVSPDLRVLQPTLQALSPDLLREKQPVVLAERIVDHEQLLRANFRYEYFLARKSTTEVAKSTPCRAKYTVLFHDFQHDFQRSQVQVDISHPIDKSQVVRVLLDARQTLVLPAHWKFSTSAPCHCWKLFDFVHAAMALFNVDALVWA